MLSVPRHTTRTGSTSPSITRSKRSGIDSITLRDSVFGAVTVPLNAIAPLLHRHFLAVLAPARVERAFGIETPVGVGAKIVAQTLEQVGRPA